MRDISPLTLKVLSKFKIIVIYQIHKKWKF